jgi:hypothetical protein
MFKIIGGDGKEYGPVSTDQLRQWVTDGRANAQTMVQAEGSTEWKPLGQFPEFAAAGAGGGVPPPVATSPARPAISSYLAPAILSTICCCLPLGIVAIIFAAQVNTKLQAGDIPGAMDASRKARMWCWIAFGVGIAFSLLYWLSVGRIFMVHSLRHFRYD